MCIFIKRPHFLKEQKGVPRRCPQAQRSQTQQLKAMGANDFKETEKEQLGCPTTEVQAPVQLCPVTQVTLALLASIRYIGKDWSHGYESLLQVAF